jgi:RNA polymerase sigma factor (TIGR02999 family)
MFHPLIDVAQGAVGIRQLFFDGGIDPRFGNSDSMSDVTKMLERINAGDDPKAAEKLLNAVYEELRIIAQAKMANEKPGQTLQATILVHDAWRKLFPGGKSTKFANRKHFFGAAAGAMRRILVDHARQKNALKRGKKVDMTETAFANLEHPASDTKILDVDDALKRFAGVDPITAKQVELRYFAGFTMEDAAKTLGISKSSAERDYGYFKAWFKREYLKNP